MSAKFAAKPLLPFSPNIKTTQEDYLKIKKPGSARSLRLCLAGHQYCSNGCDKLLFDSVLDCQH
eukprot:5808512-Amphidinium_carterae.1